MITASLVLYKSDPQEVKRVLSCIDDSEISTVYVVDNSPSDTLKDIVSLSSKSVYLFGQGNIGFGEGNNIGLRESLKAKSKYHIVLNPDIVFKPEVINELSLFMDNHPDVGCVKPALVHLDGSFNPSVFSLPTPYITFGRRLFPEKFSKHINEYFELRDCDLNEIREVPNMSGSFLFIRTSVFSKIGLFDERYFMYFEDFDLVRRIHSVSKIVYNPKVSIIHAHRAEHKFNKKLLAISIKSAFKYFNKWGWFFDADRKRWNNAARDSNAIIEN